MSTDIPITRWTQGSAEQTTDFVATESALQIRVNGQNFTVTMRTPGQDEDLVTGLLFAECIITNVSEIIKIQTIPDPANPELENEIEVTLKHSISSRVGLDLLPQRMLSNSSCGVCGKTELASIQCNAIPMESHGQTVPASVIISLDSQLRSSQNTFDRTGGLHAAGLFDAEGTLLLSKEDVGRHNAVDKVVGAGLKQGILPMKLCILMVSGRSSFEIVQKAAMAGIPVICSVSAPSSLAVQLADEMGITLVGFLRGENMNVYSHPERIIS